MPMHRAIVLPFTASRRKAEYMVWLTAGVVLFGLCRKFVPALLQAIS